MWDDKKKALGYTSVARKKIHSREIKSQACPRLEVSSRVSTRPDTAEATLNRKAFIFHYPIGRGGFGRVWKVEMRKNYQYFAMKEMEKLRIVSKRSVHSVINERSILESLKNPFIVNMCSAFQDRENLYLVMDLMPGGDLRYHIGKQKFFLESQVKFFVACIISGLEYIHNNGIIHRDIKPENLVFDSKGYLRITDFGIARVWNSENSKDTSGTPGYMAPEVICRQNHTFAVDYFALGVILYELMIGRRPYVGRDRKEIRDQIISRQAKIKPNCIPIGWSFEAVDFVNKLLQRKPSYRIGYRGASEVKEHPWLRDFNWDSMYIGALAAPFVPKNEDNFDARVAGEFRDELDMTIQLDNIQSLFEDYFYVQ